MMSSIITPEKPDVPRQYRFDPYNLRDTRFL